jgi:hypothetical protein
MKNLKTFEGFSYSEDQDFSESLQYHLENDLGLIESVFRIGSDAWVDLVNEARKLNEAGIINLSEDDLDLISTDAGRKGIFEGQEVLLDVPFFESDDFDGDVWYDEEEDVIHEAEYHGKKVNLNRPTRNSGGGTKKFIVYTKNDKGNVVKVGFGLKGARIKNANPGRAKSFQARHRCKTPGPKWKARYWACRTARYAKSLGLSSSRSW